MIFKLRYWFKYAGMYLVAVLPFSVLYALSDVFCFFMHRVVRYRIKVVRTNLSNSFPEKSKAELRQIENKFYQYICDYLIEELKMLRLSFDELSRRMQYENSQLYLDMIAKHGGIIVMIPHYANFEWLIGMGAVMRPGDLPVQVYKPLHDPYMDQLFKRIRARFGGVNIPKHSTARQLVKFYNEGKHMAVGLITDQSPNVFEAHHWTTFLNQETVFMDGAERIAKMMKFPVFYAELTKTKRGYCKVSFDLMSEFPAQSADGEITEQFARRLEATIRREPSYWFWSHKRWKLTKEQVAEHQAESR